MRFFHCFSVCGASAIALFSLAVVSTSQDSGFKECLQQKKIVQAIGDLGDDEFQSREKAFAELKAIGPPAFGQLVRATWSDDPEVRLRAEDLLAPMKAARAAVLMKQIEKSAVPAQQQTQVFGTSYYCYFTLKFTSAGLASARSEVEVEKAVTDTGEHVVGIAHSQSWTPVTANTTGTILVWVSQPKKPAKEITVNYRLPVLCRSDVEYVEAAIPQARGERFRDGVISVERKDLPGGVSEAVTVIVAVRSQHFRERPSFLLWKAGGPQFSHQPEEQPHWAGRKFVLTVLFDPPSKSGPDRLLMTYFRETRSADLRGKIVIPIPP